MSSQPGLIAIDLGAESCRVSLLQWHNDQPSITMVSRFANEALRIGTIGLCWDLKHICKELDIALRRCATLAPEGIASIGVTGWAVDYVRLDFFGKPLAPPFCYRDPRTVAAMKAVHSIIPAAELYAKTGIQIQPLNTIYQLYADKLNGAPDSVPWANLPEYILHWLGAPRIAEYTNATHTGLVDVATQDWSDDIFSSLKLDRAAAPELVKSGTVLGPVRGNLRKLPSFQETQLIAPACHDTASAIAGIPAGSSEKWAYISSGTWSLVGTLLPHAVHTPEAFASSFTNLGAAAGNILFHRGIAGMWLLRQSMNIWASEREWPLMELIAAAQKLPPPDAPLDLDDPSFNLPGDMPTRINRQRECCGLASLPGGSAAAPQYANLIFHSLAHRYAMLLNDISRLTGRRLRRIFVVGGGSQNEYLNALTAEASGAPVHRASVESSTLGNLAIQWARLEQPNGPLSSQFIADKASALAKAKMK